MAFAWFVDTLRKGIGGDCLARSQLWIDTWPEIVHLPAVLDVERGVNVPQLFLLSNWRSEVNLNWGRALLVYLWVFNLLRRLGFGFCACGRDWRAWERLLECLRNLNRHTSFLMLVFSWSACQMECSHGGSKRSLRRHWRRLVLRQLRSWCYWTWSGQDLDALQVGLKSLVVRLHLSIYYRPPQGIKLIENQIVSGLVMDWRQWIEVWLRLLENRYSNRVWWRGELVILRDSVVWIRPLILLLLDWLFIALNWSWNWELFLAPVIMLRRGEIRHFYLDCHRLLFYFQGLRDRRCGRRHDRTLQQRHLDVLLRTGSHLCRLHQIESPLFDFLIDFESLEQFVGLGILALSLRLNLGLDNPCPQDCRCLILH